MLLRSSLILAAAIAAAIALAAGCGPAPDTKPPVASASAAPQAGFDPCKDDKGGPPPGVYREILRDLHCEQELYLRMSAVASGLGVDCGYCHVPIAGTKKDFEYPKMTERKQIALFMNHQFIDGLKQKDGEPMKCRSCHVDKNGKPAAKFLGEPRDKEYALEWMNLVMVNKFTKLDGSKLKCKDCHVGNIGQPDFKPEVILHAEQMNLVGVTPFARYPDASAPPTPSVTASASAGPPPSATSSAKPPSTAKPPGSAKPVTTNPSSSDPNLFPPGKH